MSGYFKVLHSMLLWLLHRTVADSMLVLWSRDDGEGDWRQNGMNMRDRDKRNGMNTKDRVKMANGTISLQSKL